MRSALTHSQQSNSRRRDREAGEQRDKFDMKDEELLYVCWIHNYLPMILLSSLQNLIVGK